MREFRQRTGWIGMDVIRESERVEELITVPRWKYISLSCPNLWEKEVVQQVGDSRGIASFHFR